MYIYTQRQPPKVVTKITFFDNLVIRGGEIQILNIFVRNTKRCRPLKHG